MEQLVEEFISSINCNVKKITVEIEDTDICFGEIFSRQRRKLSFIAINNDFSEIFEHPNFPNDPYFTTNLPREPPRAPRRDTENTRQEPSTSTKEETGEQQPKVKKSVRIENMRKRQEIEKEKNKNKKDDPAVKQESSKQKNPLKRRNAETKSHNEIQNGSKKRRITRQCQ